MAPDIMAIHLLRPMCPLLVRPGACIGLVFLGVTACGGEGGQWPEPGEEGTASPDESSFAVAQVQQPSVSASWLVATGGIGLNTTTADSQIGTDANSNFAIALWVHGTRGLRVEPTTAGVPNLIGGSLYNTVTKGAVASAIAGGGAQSHVNTVTDSYGFVGGGQQNQAGDAKGTTSDAAYAVVGGGYSNTASATTAVVSGGNGNTASQVGAFVGAGQTNTASGQFAVIGGGSQNTASGNYSAIGGGSANRAVIDSAVIAGGLNNLASGALSTIAGGHLNTATAAISTIAGGDNNTVDGQSDFVGGGSTNHASGTTSTIAGGTSNTASVDYATVGGGQSNVASGPTATIAGGSGNTADGQSAFIGGGSSNHASGVGSTIAGGSGSIADWDYATVGGGLHGTASGLYATVAGGHDNHANEYGATVVGGEYNYATGGYSTVLGGVSNSASGSYSLAAGTSSSADYQGCFVWSDTGGGGAGGVNCGGLDRFVARASGGVYFYSNRTSTAGVVLTAGANAWAAVSDRNAKQDFVPVNARDVLERVAAMPVTTWTYKSEPGVRHMGPMAQDFRAAFGLGTNDKSIVTVDADGVALAAIQGVNEKVSSLEVESRALRAENRGLRERLDRLEATSHPAAFAGISPGNSVGFLAMGVGFGTVFLVSRRRRERT